MKTYGVEYSYEGKTYSVYLHAESWSDAENRLRALAGGEIYGQIVEVTEWDEMPETLAKAQKSAGRRVYPVASRKTHMESILRSGSW